MAVTDRPRSRPFDPTRYTIPYQNAGLPRITRCRARIRQAVRGTPYAVYDPVTHPPSRPIDRPRPRPSSSTRVRSRPRSRLGKIIPTIRDGSLLGVRHISRISSLLPTWHIWKALLGTVARARNLGVHRKPLHTCSKNLDPLEKD